MADFYNIEEIRSELTALVRKSNFESARQLYTERIMDWTDYYTENLCNNDDNNTSEDINIAIRSICQLWIDFAEMEINQKQYKKASQIFDKAIEDPIVKTSSSIYLRYSSFCEIINKLGYARTILIRGLTSQLSQVDADFLWVELLQIVQKLGSPNLTMQLLYDAIVLEKSTENVTKPSDALLNLMEVDVASSHPLITENILTNTTDIATNNVIKTQSVTMETMPLPVEHVVNIARNYDDVSYLTPEQLTSTFVTRPPMLFNFSDQVSTNISEVDVIC